MASIDVEEFVRRTRAFCAFVDTASELALAERIDVAIVLLLDLYTAMMSLPAPEPPEVFADALPSEPRLTMIDFDRFDVYWQVFDPYEQADPVCGLLSDDLRDIHRDVIRGLRLWDAAHHTDALWQWRFDFDTHWGMHVVDALRALHAARGALRDDG